MPDREHQRAPKRETAVGVVCDAEDVAQGGQTRREDTEIRPAARWKRRMRLGLRCGEGDDGQQQEEEEDKNSSRRMLLQTRLFALNRNRCQCQCQCQCREHQRQRIGRVAADAKRRRWLAVVVVEVEDVRQDGFESEVVVDNAQWRQCCCSCCQIQMRERSGCWRWNAAAGACGAARLDRDVQGPGRHLGLLGRAGPL